MKTVFVKTRCLKTNCWLFHAIRLGFCWLLLAGVASATEIPRFAVEVGVEPVGRDESASTPFACSFLVTDLATEKVLFAPKVKVPRGETGELRTANVPSGGSVAIDVDARCGVDAEGGRVTYSLEIRKSAEEGDGTLLLRHSSQVVLEP